MNKPIFKTILITLSAIFIYSCATTPVVQVPQPWTRSMGDPQLIEHNTTIYLNIIGNEEHLLLDNSLVDRKIYKIIENQLMRRNFTITDNEQEADYLMVVNYSSRDVEVMRTSVGTTQRSSQVNYSQTGTGVLAALAVGAQSTQSQATSRVESRTHTAYRHTLGLSISSLEGEMIWTGESTWESGAVDILRRIQPVSQILISNLPGYAEMIPRVPAVRQNKEQNYYRLYIRGNRFFGPALPYSINFEGLSSSGSGAIFVGSSTQRSASQSGDLRSVSDTRILNAVIDLIQTAEYAVPHSPEYDDPFYSQQWSRVNIGGRYFIGDDTEPSNILVELRGSREGYTIRNASLVHESTYNEFLVELEKWQKALSEFYNVFE
ncbi:MAG: hypothetical protein LAT67_12605 [Balneolales bacterium]|nr:hypothetical protein [Balneolales bacterium]